MYSTANNLWTFTWFVHFELPFRLKGTEKIHTERFFKLPSNIYSILYVYMFVCLFPINIWTKNIINFKMFEEEMVAWKETVVTVLLHKQIAMSNLQAYPRSFVWWRKLNIVFWKLIIFNCEFSTKQLTQFNCSSTYKKYTLSN